MSQLDLKNILISRSLQDGRRISLRLFSAKDITRTYLEWLRDAEVVRFSNQRFVTHSMETCQTYLASFNDNSNFFLAICDRKTEAVLGTMTVYYSLPHRTADIGIMLGERRIWGQGIGSEAFTAVTEALLAAKEIRKVTAGTLAVNTAMVRIMEKAGMHHEATRHAHELVEDVPVDVVYYARFRND